MLCMLRLKNIRYHCRRAMSSLVKTEVIGDKIGLITLCDSSRLNALTGRRCLMVLVVYIISIYLTIDHIIQCIHLTSNLF